MCSPKLSEITSCFVLLQQKQQSCVQVMPFFSKLGFQCPEAKGDADFLQDVTIQTGQGQFRKDQSRKHDYMPVQVTSSPSPMLLLLPNSSATALYISLQCPQHLPHLVHADDQAICVPATPDQ